MCETVQLKTTNPRKGTETYPVGLESIRITALKTTNPRKGTETAHVQLDRYFCSY